MTYLNIAAPHVMRAMFISEALLETNIVVFFKTNSPCNVLFLCLLFCCLWFYDKLLSSYLLRTRSEQDRYKSFNVLNWQTSVLLLTNLPSYSLTWPPVPARRSIFDWDSKPRTIAAFFAFMIGAYSFELYMAPVGLLVVFFKGWVVSYRALSGSLFTDGVAASPKVGRRPAQG